MTETFGSSTKTGTQGTDAGDRSTSLVDITAEELAALKRRDDNAQQHIPRLETENEELREKLAQLSLKLDSATTLDDVLERLNNKSGESNSQTLDPNKVAEMVENRLSQKNKEASETANWNKTVTELTGLHGSWAAADKAIMAKSAELGMTVQEASRMARQLPDAFRKLFMIAEKSSPAQQTSSSASFTSANSAAPGGSSDAALEERRKYYQELRRKNPNKYWNVDTQIQYRKDMGFA
jgi:predicted  nucleic acid-binding Zn-ribbon protein